MAKKIESSSEPTAEPENGKVVGAVIPSKQVTIPRPNFQTVMLEIRGSTPMVQEKFSAKARQEIHDKHAAGSTSKKGVKREPKDFMGNYQQAMHRLPDGRYALPCAAFRAAMISACRTVGFQMTKMKLAVFVLADGYETDDGTALLAITKGEPAYFEIPVRNDSGVVDLRRVRSGNPVGRQPFAFVSMRTSLRPST